MRAVCNTHAGAGVAPADFVATITEICDQASDALVNARRAVVEMRAVNAGAVDDQLAEALTNARNHAACDTVLVTCAYGRRALRVEVRDDGRGFDAKQAGANGHFGLVGMRERAAAIGARVSIESTPGRGTTVVLVIPRNGSD
ncbi:MAG: ATP-binding protein [Gemmatimonadaceae bacterium]|nr:ATP-binding protein [Gemmatimonadaceae bacterium]